MTPAERAFLLRKRFKTLYPMAVKNVAAAKPKTVRPVVEPRKPYPRDFSLVGSRHSEIPVAWARSPDEKKHVTVEMLKRRDGPLPLTVISGKLQPGSVHLAMRREW